MKSHNHKAVSDLCARVARDSLIVQGGGGNASWKEASVLWVKASGTRLGDANIRDIFMPVDLTHLQERLALGDFNVEPRSLGGDGSRPSIETLLHALMPQKYVLHVHAIDPLAILVREDAEASLIECMTSKLTWVFVEYHKPGGTLAQAIKDNASQLDQVDVIFMANHGIVVAADTVNDLENKLNEVLELTRQTPCSLEANLPLIKKEPTELAKNYQFSESEAVNSLAVNRDLLRLCKSHWVMYPDHAIFLGARPTCISDARTIESAALNENVIFLEGAGVLIRKGANPAVVEQLQCYCDVLARVGITMSMRALTDQQIGELLDWDAEKYRQLQAEKSK